MKLLFDQNLSFKLSQRLIDLFPGSVQARLVGLAEAEDRVVWNNARAHWYTLVTLDADFAELAALLGSPPKVIWLRCGNQPTAAIEKLIRDRADLIAGLEDTDMIACVEIH
jgi:predicted nuclease of predicted toxin-antitoxin system